MYSAVVIDDEPRVTRGLSRLIPRLDPEWSVVGQAKNGLEGIELVKSKKPDLVITDIRMPKMNGLDMLNSLRTDQVHIVVLSGYGYFEYAQTAIKFGAFDYLLKPMKSEQIYDVLQRIKQIKKDQNQQNKQQLHSSDYSAEWKEWLLYSSLSQTALPANLQKALKFKERQARVVMIEIDALDELVAEDSWGDRKLVSFAVRNVLGEIMESLYPIEYLFMFQEGTQLLYLCLGSCHEETQIEHARQMVDAVKTCLKLSISVSVSESIDEVRQIPESFRQASIAMQNKWIRGHGSVNTYTDTLINDADAAHYPLSLEEAIILSIRHAKTDDAVAYTREFFAAISHRQMSYQLFRRYYMQLSAAVIRVLYEYHIYDIVLKELPNIYDLLEKHSSVEYMHRIMRELITASVSAVEWTKTRKNGRISELALQYIHEQYMKDVSLEDVAGQIQMSPNYFSTFFKQELGVTFVEYLTRLRIDKAKSLMANGQLRLYEIAAMVGYQDVKYFSRVFKRNVGVTPAEYRSFFFRKEQR